MRTAGWKDWLVFSDVHILLVAVGWMLGGSALVGYVLPWPFLVVGAIGAFLVYRLDHVLVESPEDLLNAPERRAFAKGARTPLLVSAALLACVAVVILVLAADWWWGAVLGVGVAGMLYPLPLFPGGRRPKDYPLLKSALIVGCWVGGGIWLPAALFANSSGPDLHSVTDWAVVVGYRAAYVFPNLIAVDWLDREGDRKEKAGNLVAHWSRRTAVVAIVTSWIVATALLTAHFALEVSPVLFLIELTGLTGLCVTAIRTLVGSEVGRRSDTPSIALDLWVAFPLFSWLWWMFA